jgi:hypothetical protein
VALGFGLSSCLSACARACVCVSIHACVRACASVCVRVARCFQLHALGDNWGSASGVGGQIGSDDVCVSNCPWTKQSGLKYDYAIFVA